jgi:hypothetical protein
MTRRGPGWLWRAALGAAPRGYLRKGQGCVAGGPAASRRPCRASTGKSGCSSRSVSTPGRTRRVAARRAPPCSCSARRARTRATRSSSRPAVRPDARAGPGAGFPRPGHAPDAIADILGITTTTVRIVPRKAPATTAHPCRAALLLPPGRRERKAAALAGLQKLRRRRSRQLPQVIWSRPRCLLPGIDGSQPSRRRDGEGGPRRTNRTVEVTRRRLAAFDQRLLEFCG